MVILLAMSYILWLAGSLLDFVINFTILQMSAKISNMTGINVAWRVIRDVLNMCFIFLLLYNAILVIVSKRNIGEIKKVLTGIVITALLINFSMFFTEVIIDASNIATIGFYQSIQTVGQSSTVPNGQVIQTGISGAFVNALHVTDYFNSDSLNNVGQPATPQPLSNSNQGPVNPNASASTASTKSQSNTQLFIVGIFGSVLFMILAFCFFAISMMLIIRFLVLIFLLMLSPVGFIGFGLPQLDGQQKEWWTTLIGQCIFAPLYMLLTWVVLTLMASPGFISMTNNASGQPAHWSDIMVGGQGGSMGLMLNFVLVIGLVITTLIIDNTLNE